MPRFEMVRFEWNIPGFQQLRREPGVRRDLEGRGQAVLAACGGEARGYRMSSHPGAPHPQGRWQVAVFTATPRAMVSNARHNTLVRNFGAARG